MYRHDGPTKRHKRKYVFDQNVVFSRFICLANVYAIMNVIREISWIGSRVVQISRDKPIQALMRSRKVKIRYQVLRWTWLAAFLRICGEPPESRGNNCIVISCSFSHHQNISASISPTILKTSHKIQNVQTTRSVHLLGLH